MSSTVAAVTDLHVRFATPTGIVHAVRGVTLDIAEGEILALVGESGSGKSVLSRCLLGLPPVSAATTVEGGAVVAGVDMLGRDERAKHAVRRSLLGAVFQDPLTSLDPTMRVGAQVLERDRDVERGVRALDDCGVPEPRTRLRQWPHELSGGLRQRVGIAGAITGDPEPPRGGDAELARLRALIQERRGEPVLVIADEPTTALDVRVQARVIDLFDRLRREHRTAVLLITHDLGVAAQVADRIAVLQSGVLCEVGPAQEVLANPQHPYTRSLLRDRIDVSDPAPTRVPVLGDAAPALRLTDIVKTYRSPSGGRHVAVDGAGLAVRPGGSLALVGESGSGKSTLLRVAAGLIRPDSGDVVLADPGSRPQMVFQDAGSSLTPWLSVGRQIAERMRVRGVPRGEARDRTAALLDQVGLDGRAAASRPAGLSGGQRQRAAIARALASSPTVLLCDEPVSALDASLAARTLDLLQALQDSLGFAIVLVTHDLAVAKRIGVDLAVMHRGRIVEAGTVESVFADPQHEYTRDLLRSSPSIRAAG